MKSKPRCVVHCRVSTAKQAYEGESLEVQVAICLDIAERNGWEVAHSPWLEAYSGRKNARPAFAEVLAFLDAHPRTVQYYVFRAIDRFTRGGTATYEDMKAELARRGVELVDSMGVIQPPKNTLEHVGFEYEWSRVSPSEVAEAVLATTAKAEATTILTRLIGQEIRLTQQGYKIRDSVDGYLNQRVQVNGKRRVIQVADPERARFYVPMFELRALGGLSDEEIVERVNAMGFLSRVRNRWDAKHQHIVRTTGGQPLSVKRYQEVIKRPIYCGVLVEKWTNWQPVKAAYAGLVSIETWNAANRGARYVSETPQGLTLLFDVNAHRRVRSKCNPTYPYRRVILCPACRKPFLGSASRSKAGHHVPAYHCSRSHPRVARNKAAFEESVSTFVARLRFRSIVVQAAVGALRARYHQRTDELGRAAEQIRKSLADLEAQKTEIVKAFPAATSATMRTALENNLLAIDDRIARTSLEMRSSEISEQDLEAYLRDLTELMEHPSILLKNIENPVVLRSRFDLAFAELPTLTEIENGTPKLSPILSLCEGEEDPKSVQVLSVGIEPTLQLPQSCVLSIERRERVSTVPFLAASRKIRNANEK